MLLVCSCKLVKIDNSGIFRCSSNVGRQGGMQKVSIGYGCEFEGVIIHELMHSTGFWHEHSRQDRDYYVRINWGNIKRGEEANFYKKNWGTHIQSLQVSYDLGEEYLLLLFYS